MEIRLLTIKSKNYFQVTTFENIISVGDGVWDVKTAKNLGIYFLGIRDKNLKEFQKFKKIKPRNIKQIYNLRDYVHLKLNALGI